MQSAFAPQSVVTSHWTAVPSPVGEILLLGDGEALTGLYMTQGRHVPDLSPALRRCDACFIEARRQLYAYFGRELQRFSLLLSPQGTPFQLRVWDALLDIPYGQTEAYGDLARRIGRDGAARAVGRANGLNPISIVIPCHRVIGRDGSLTGYGGGLHAKSELLALEAGARPDPWM
jgi:methylated-DNA-[protein]-cysteine S-methyltransferase